MRNMREDRAEVGQPFSSEGSMEHAVEHDHQVVGGARHAWSIVNSLCA
jgi:hypothetical protein